MRIAFLSALLAFALVPAYAQSGRGFSDEFNGNQLDTAKWSVFRGMPLMSGHFYKFACRHN